MKDRHVGYVYRGDKKRPLVRISGETLERAGFRTGDGYTLTIQDGEIIIKTVPQQNGV